MGLIKGSIDLLHGALNVTLTCPAAPPRFIELPQWFTGGPAMASQPYNSVQLLLTDHNCPEGRVGPEGRCSLFILGRSALHLATDQSGYPIGECAPILFGQFLGSLFQIGINSEIEDFGLRH